MVENTRANMNTPDSTPENTSNPLPGRRAFLKASSFASVLATSPKVLAGLITTAGGASPMVVTTTHTTTVGTDKKMKPKSPANFDVTGDPLNFVINGHSLSVTPKLTASVKVGTPAPLSGNAPYTIKATAVQSGYSDVPPVTFSFTANCNPVSGVITHLGSSGGGDESSQHREDGDSTIYTYRIWVVPAVTEATDTTREVTVAVHAQLLVAGQWTDVVGTVNGASASTATAVLKVEWEPAP